MKSQRRSATHPTPTGVYAYFDKIQVWVRTPINQATLAQLRKQCGRGGIHVDNRPAQFSAQYRQRVELRQPSDQALSWLAARDDALINRLEITIDLMFRCLADRDDAWEFIHYHLVRRWHGRQQQVRVYVPEAATTAHADVIRGTRYDAGPSAPNTITFYREEHSRITGEINCLHLEWRAKGLKAVRAAGIESGRDLLEFSHRAFWQKRLLLYDVDRRRLGRLIRNQSNGKRSRVSEIKETGRYRVSLDGRTGEVIVRSVDTIQDLIDQWKGSHRVHRALVPISNEVLLPIEGMGCE